MKLCTQYTVLYYVIVHYSQVQCTIHTAQPIIRVHGLPIEMLIAGALSPESASQVTGTHIDTEETGHSM